HDEPPDRGLLPADGSGTVPVEEPMVLESRERAGPEGWPQDHPKRARRSWALRARDGVLAVLLCGGAGMILIDLYRKALVERALAEIERAGGTYLRQAGGRSGPVVALDLDATIVFDNGEVHERGRATDAILPTIAQLGDLRELSLDGAGVTDAGLVHLKRLKKLRRLNLSR